MLVTRDAWDARPPRTAPVRLGSARGTKVHYVGERIAPELARDGNHDRCALVVRGIQRHHMDDNGWNDIAYNLLVCPHGHVFAGRGAHVQSAANGPGLNDDHYAVCALLGDEGLTVPPSAMLHGLRDAIEYLRGRGDAGTEIKGHRDGYPTTCPGDRLYAWIRAGAPRPGRADMCNPAEDVWHYEIKAPWVDPPGDDMWRAETHLRVMHAHVRDLEDKHAVTAADVVAIKEKVEAIPTDVVAVIVAKLDAMAADIAAIKTKVGA